MVIPNGYDRCATWQMETHGVTREQLAMVPVLESHHLFTCSSSTHQCSQESVRVLHEISKICGKLVIGRVNMRMPWRKRPEHSEKYWNPSLSAIIPAGRHFHAMFTVLQFRLFRTQFAIILIPNFTTQNGWNNNYGELPQIRCDSHVGTNLLECARRADGAAAIIVCASKFLQYQRPGMIGSICSEISWVKSI